MVILTHRITRGQDTGIRCTEALDAWLENTVSIRRQKSRATTKRSGENAREEGRNQVKLRRIKGIIV
jgi:hypothetical protein